MEKFPKKVLCINAKNLGVGDDGMLKENTEYTAIAEYGPPHAPKPVYELAEIGPLKQGFIEITRTYGCERFVDVRKIDDNEFSNQLLEKEEVCQTKMIAM